DAAGMNAEDAKVKQGQPLITEARNPHAALHADSIATPKKAARVLGVLGPHRPREAPESGASRDEPDLGHLASRRPQRSSMASIFTRRSAGHKQSCSAGAARPLSPAPACPGAAALARRRPGCALCTRRAPSPPSKTPHARQLP